MGKAKLTCLEFTIAKKANQGALKLFRLKRNQDSALPETKDLKTFEEWDELFNEFNKA